MAEETDLRYFLLVFALAAVLRLTGIHYGLPAVFNADEPHIVNVAVSFGAGTLNPHFFRYPTLWMYILFAAYGVFFAVWSGLGLIHNTQQFGALFVWNPTPFYLIARILAAVFSLLAIDRVYRSGNLVKNQRTGLWAAAMLAVPNPVVASAHAAKPESLMFFLGACAWYFALRYLNEGKERDLTLCALTIGLCGASQYTAAPLAILVPTAWLIKREGNVIWALAAVPIGFLIGCPYALLNYSGFLQMTRDLRAMGHLGGLPPMNWWLVLRNVPRFSGAWLPGVILFPLGAYQLLKTELKKALLMLAPIAAFWITMSSAFDGSIPRYLFAVYPAIALIAGVGAEAALSWCGEYARRPVGAAGKVVLQARGTERISPLGVAAALAVLMIPGSVDSIASDREILLPDTRTMAAVWIEQNIPQGAKILIDQEHASPRLRPSLALVTKMAEQTKTIGHPRYRYYELMRQSHPGGGYEAYQIYRDAKDLWAMPGHVAFSEQGRPTLDVRPGLEAALHEGIQYIVLTSYGVDPARAPEFEKFLQETEKEGKLLKDLDPAPGKEAGPRIRIFRIQ